MTERMMTRNELHVALLCKDAPLTESFLYPVMSKDAAQLALARYKKALHTALALYERVEAFKEWGREYLAIPTRSGAVISSLYGSLFCSLCGSALHKDEPHTPDCLVGRLKEIVEEVSNANSCSADRGVKGRDTRTISRTPEERQSLREWIDSIMGPRRRAREEENRRTRRPNPGVFNQPMTY